MGKKIYLIAIVSILVLSLFMAAQQLIADSYYRMAHHDGNDLNRAIGYLEKCVAIDGGSPLFHFSLGTVYLRKGLAEAAKRGKKNRWVRKSIDELHKAIELKPSASEYHFHLGISYGALGYPPALYWGRIEDSFERTALLNPTDVRHLYAIGIYYLREYQRLKHTGLTIEGMGPTHNKIYSAKSKENYQLFFRRSVNVDEEYLTKILEKSFRVTQEYTELRSLIRDTARSHVILARFLSGNGMWKEARKEYMMAINREPFNPIYYAEFANAFSIRGDFENAIKWWQKQKMVNPRDKEIYLSLSYGFMRLNRVDEALRELRELIELNPENINYHVKLIRTLLVARRHDEAVDEYYKVVGKNKSFSRSSYDRIRQYQMKGDYPKAVRILNEALASAVNR